MVWWGNRSLPGAPSQLRAPVHIKCHQELQQARVWCTNLFSNKPQLAIMHNLMGQGKNDHHHIA